MYSVAYRVLRDAGVAEEVLQDVFYQPWCRASDYDASRGKLAAWLLVTARNRAIDRLRWQHLKPFEKLAGMLLDHLEGILNYCWTRIAMGVVEAINGNIKTLLRRGRGYKNLRSLLLKAQRMAATRTEFVPLKKAA